MNQLFKKIPQDKLIEYIIITFPLSFILGNAFVNLHMTFFLFYFVYNFSKIKSCFDKKLILAPLLIWFFLIFTTLFNNYPFNQDFNYQNIIKSILYLRILILPISLAFILYLYPNIKHRLLNFLILITLIISIDVIFQFNFGVNLINLYSANHGMRNSSFFGSELISGSYLSKFLTLTVAYILIFYTNFRKNYKYFIILIPIITILGILLSGERMAFLNAMFSLFILILLTKNKKIIIVTGFIVFLTTFSLSNSDNLKKRYIYNIGAHLIGVDNAEGLGIYKDIYKKLNQGIHAKIFTTSLQLSKDSLVIGKGIKSYRHECIKFKKDNCSTHPHNMFLELLHDAGIPLLLLFYYYFTLMIINIFKIKNKSYYDYAIIATLITLVNPIQITGSVFSTWSASIMFFIFGLALIPNKNESE